MGGFAATVLTRGEPVGRYAVTADCGAPLAVGFDVVLAAAGSPLGGTISLILLFLLGVLAIYGPRVRARGRR